MCIGRRSRNEPHGHGRHRHRRAAAWTALLCAALCTASGLAAAPASATAATVYLDCSRPVDGNGTQASPYNALADVNTLTLAPGDTLALAAGATCLGTLAPKGSGTATAPITIALYGAGPAPIVDGNGAENALTLTNQDHWTIGAIELTDPAPSEAQREGLLIQSTDGTAHTGYDIDGLIVDNVAGETNKATQATQFANSACIRTGAVNPGSTLNDVHVHNASVSNCGGGGIKVRVGALTAQGTGVHVDHNSITAVGGDGIIASYANAPLVEYNTAADLGTGA